MVLQDGVQGLVKSVEEEERALAPGHVRAPRRERCSHIDKLLVKETRKRQRGKKKKRRGGGQGREDEKKEGKEEKERRKEQWMER